MEIPPGIHLRAGLPPGRRRRRPSPGPSGNPKRLRFQLVTVSTSKYRRRSRNEAVDDESGDVAENALKRSGHDIAGRSLVSDDPSMLRSSLEEFLSGPDDAILFVGGTGVSPDDVTIETMRPYIQKELEGFGELFRMLSYEKIGAPAILTRSMAGIAGGRLIVCLPGSPDGVKTALEFSLPHLPEVVEAKPGPGQGAQVGLKLASAPQ